MGTFGLNREEQDANILQYNHALFDNMARFMDFVWEINPTTDSLYIMYESQVHNIEERKFTATFFLRVYAKQRIAEGRGDEFTAQLSMGALRNLTGEVITTFPLYDANREPHASQFVITPAFDESGKVERVYVSARDVQDEIDEENRRLRVANAHLTRTISEQEQVRLAKISNSIMLFSINLTQNLIEEEFFEIIEGKKYSMLDMVGLSAPCALDDFLKAIGTMRVDEGSRAAFFEKTDRQRLIGLYESGVCHDEAEFDMSLGRGIDLVTHNAIHLFEDSETGDIIGTVSVTDVTEQRRKEKSDAEALHSTSAELIDMETLLVAQLVKVLKVDLSTDTFTELRVEQGEHGVKGYSQKLSEWLVGFARTGNVHPDDMERYLEFSKLEGLKEDFESGAVSRSIEYRRLIDGEFRWVRMELVKSANYSEADQGAVLCVTDINRDKVQQEALELAIEHSNRANAAKTDFLSSMSHDIRTPMNAIVGLTAIAEAHIAEKERVEDCLEKITVSSKHLLGLINEVLDMNKIESGKMSISPEEFNLSELIENLVSMVEPLVSAHHHTFNVRIQNLEHDRVVGDDQRIQQVFMNMMSNAVKYTPDGGTIQLTIREMPTDRPTVCGYEFVFEDNGMGIEPGFMPYLFEPFARAKDSRTEGAQGTGLGLPISRNIVRMMNGDITVESQVNKGSKFTVTLFLELQDQAIDLDEVDFEGLPILVVDDDEIDIENISTTLRRLGIEVEAAYSGEDAVRMVSERHEQGSDYFAAFVDWRMPRMDGIDTTARIREIAGDATSIVIISACDWSEIEAEARRVGVKDFLSKPVFRSRLIHVIKQLLGTDSPEEKKSGFEVLDSAAFAGKRALMAEDNDINAEIAIEVFKAMGLATDRVANGQEAVDAMNAAADGQYNVVFMDIQMPVMNGYEAARTIRSSERAYLKDVPIIALTADAFVDDVMAAKAAGMNAHVSKPLDFAHLQSVLGKLIG